MESNENRWCIYIAEGPVAYQCPYEFKFIFHTYYTFYSFAQVVVDLLLDKHLLHNTSLAGSAVLAPIPKLTPSCELPMNHVDKQLYSNLDTKEQRVICYYTSPSSLTPNMVDKQSCLNLEFS